MGTEDFESGYTDDATLESHSDWTKIHDGGTGSQPAIVDTVDLSGNFILDVKQLPYNGYSRNASWVLDGTYPDDQACQFDVNTVENHVLLAGARLGTNGDGYAVLLAPGFLRSIRYLGETPTVLSSTYPSTSDGDDIEIICAGTDIDCKHNGTGGGNATDSTHSSGEVGVYLYEASNGTDGNLDNMEYTDPSGGGGGSSNSPAMMSAGL